MAPSPAPRPFMGVGTVIAIVIAKIAAGISAYEAGGPAMVLAVVDLLVATFGMWWAEQRDAIAVRVLLGVQLVFAAVMLVITGGEGFLITMPLASMAVLFLAPRVALALVFVLVVLFVAVISAEYPIEIAARASLSFASAIGFVWAFSQLMVRERSARSEVERLLGDLSEAHAQLAAQMKEIELLAAAGERNRIAREIHDGLGHTLSVASIQLEAARSETAPAERIARVQGVLREGLGELRRSVSMLRDGDPRGRAFPDAIAGLVRDSETPSCTATFTIEGEPRLVPAALGFTLYRSAQEALTNARKHAGAQHVAVELVYAASEVSLSVRDDGRGTGPIVRGNGLVGLAERAALVGGTLRVERAPQRGVVLRVALPLSRVDEVESEVMA